MLQRYGFITHTNHLKAHRVEFNVRMLFFFQELNAQKQEILQIEYERGNRNNLLEYLRSLDPDMVMPQNFHLIIFPFY